MTAAFSSQDASQHGQRRHDKYDRFVATARAAPKLKVAVAHPCDQASLSAVFEATELGPIEPILVGPRAKILAAAEALGKDVSTMRIVEAPHSHAAAEEAVNLVQNALDLVRALQVELVRVAILSATETVNPKVPSTNEAAALCKMADCGQITGGILDVPLALDNTIDRSALSSPSRTSEP